jgi:hypothetical protein
LLYNPIIHTLKIKAPFVDAEAKNSTISHT